MRLLHWLIHELAAFLIATLYFLSWFLLVILLKKLLLEDYNIQFNDYFSAVIIALVTAKVVVIFEGVSFGRQAGLSEVVLRSAVYSVAALILLLIEHALSTRSEAGGFASALLGAFHHPDAPRIWATLICLAIAFAAYTAVAVLRREFGTEPIVSAFLRPPKTSGLTTGGDAGA